MIIAPPFFISGANMPLSTSDIDKLEDLLFADNLQDEALDYFGLHGLACASVVGPAPINLETIKTLTFSGLDPKATSEQNAHFEQCVKNIQADIKEALIEGIEPVLPYENEEDVEACQESWCMGFIEGFFSHESLWFEKNEEIAAELLLPIMTLSNLFDNEEFTQIRKSDKLMAQFEGIIADQLTDIYLYYHADQ